MLNCSVDNQDVKQDDLPGVVKMNADISKVNLERRSNGRGLRFVDIITEAIEIRSHEQFLFWAQGALQKFLPHDVMIAAWGDFSLGIIYYDIISSIPGARTHLMQEKEMAAFLKRLYFYWASKDKTPSHVVAERTVIRCREIRDCKLRSHMQSMKTALVHAIKDVRGGSDSFYVLLSSKATVTPKTKQTFHQILPYLDATLRQIEHLPHHDPVDYEEPDEEVIIEHGLTIESALKLSDRESEIMGWVCLGKTNDEIGSILRISTFTVKNHLQRIFKKLQVVNRSQAVAMIRGQVTFI